MVDILGTTMVDVLSSPRLYELPAPPGDYPGWGLPCLVPDPVDVHDYEHDQAWYGAGGRRTRRGHRQAFADFLGLRYDDPEMPGVGHHRCEVKACRQIAHLEGTTHRDHVKFHRP